MRLLVEPEVAGFFDPLRGFSSNADLKRWDQTIRNRIDLRILLGGPRDDQRRSCFIYQDRVDLIHNGEMEITLNTGFGGKLHIVA